MEDIIASPATDTDICISPTFGDKLFLYLKENPNDFDVTFLVGPEKEKVKALKIALKATCPTMDGFFKEHSDWDQPDYLKNGIPLPDVDPQAFRIFLNILVADTWTFDEVESMKLPAQVLFNLVAISKRFEMLEMKAHLESLTQSFLVDFHTFIQTEEYLKLTKTNLESILSSDEISIDEFSVFEAASLWAENQCSQQGLEVTGANIRSVLGDTLFLIRFPAMTNTEFGKVISSTKILNPEEQLEIFKYISLNQSEKEKLEGMKLPFCTDKRRKSALNSLPLVSFLADCPKVDNPAFICDGIEFRNYFQVNQKIAVHSIGFLGPIDSDSFYDVYVEIFKHSSSCIESFGSAYKKIYAKQREIFHILFDTPIVLEATYVQEGLFKKFGYYRVEYCLKGPNTQSAEVVLCKNFKIDAEGIGFYCRWDSEQLTEIRFTPC